ncbi:hypothetical protein C5167_025033 [Papaver somniferum]|uniref:Uncharacterized protein n=1 Tax=Papaver somniferum TaxID=3469 RepID=A0A4Y7JQA3_PAPSO|nr:hypothetical protein C5167_025033 [Papaver somniferum]
MRLSDGCKSEKLTKFEFPLKSDLKREQAVHVSLSGDPARLGAASSGTRLYSHKKQYQGREYLQLLMARPVIPSSGDTLLKH